MMSQGSVDMLMSHELLLSEDTPVGPQTCRGGVAIAAMPNCQKLGFREVKRFFQGHTLVYC